MGISDEELAETVQLAAAVAAGSVATMAKRAQKAVDSERQWLSRGEGKA